MKKVLITIAICAMLSMVANVYAVYADTTGSATTLVFCDVVANLGIVPLITVADGGDIQADQEAKVSVPFKIDANTQDITMSAFVSNLYKGDDPANSDADPILISGRGVGMVPERGGEVGGELDEVALYDRPGVVDSYPGMYTQTIQLEASDVGHFSQNVVVSAAWKTTDDEQPMGTYSGLIEVTAGTFLRG